jgi:glycosyltransferase involved in cell wall biosynthesis
MLDRMKMPPDAAFCVANSMDFSPFENLQRTPSAGTLRVLYLGRVNDTEKGAFFVPPILSRLRDLPVKLTIAGDGPDLPELRRRLAPEADRVNFLGSVPITDVPSLVATHDILLLPSRFEGFGYSLIEAMAGGCVPVASRVTGATDFVVQHEKTGLLFPTGDVAAAADAIRRLHNQPQLLQTCANNGLIDVRNRFSIDAMSAAYTRVLDALQNPRHLPNLKTGQPFELLPIANQWRRFLPAPVKNLLRKFVYK